MKADSIFKNATIFTADKNQPEATALVVKDGKFAYVGDASGLAAYEGEVTDLGGNVGGNPIAYWPAFIGEKRAHSMFRCKTMWDSGALVTWSSDEVFYGDFKNWSPYLAMEIGMTRWINGKTRFEEASRTVAAFPPASERMNIEEMILGFTINGARQLGVEAVKGSISAGKDADFLVFEKDLLTAEQEGFSYNLPQEVYFGGKKI